MTFDERWFRREDERNDTLFYIEPRMVVHIDDHAIAAIREYLSESLPQNGRVLDLMSSWRSHMPEGHPVESLVGLGLNGKEMAENPQVDDRVVHDLNRKDRGLPFRTASFDAVVVTVSVQYMTRPVEVFGEVHRVLRPNGWFHVIYSNRMFPTKAVAVWKALDDEQRGALIGKYFGESGKWSDVTLLDIGRPESFYTDPVYVVRGRAEK